MIPEDKADAVPDKSVRGGAGEVKEKAIGDALRRVYREAVDEQVPDEMIDLLKRLG